MKIKRNRKLNKIQKIKLNSLIKEATYAAKDNGQEICGLLIDNGYFIELIKVKNKVKNGAGFAFYVNEIHNIENAAKVLQHEIIGTFHSHPYSLAEPGDGDIANALDDQLMMIIDCQAKEAKLWKINKSKAKEIKIELI